jgi:hypothetical protein
MEEENKIGNEQKPTGQRSLTLEDCSSYLSTKVGVKYVGRILKYIQDFETPYPMKIRENNIERSAGYAYTIVFDDDRKMSISSWKLHGLLKDTFSKAKKIEGLKIEIEHVKKGTKDEIGWTVKVLEG